MAHIDKFHTIMVCLLVMCGIGVFTTIMVFGAKNIMVKNEFVAACDGDLFNCTIVNYEYSADCIKQNCTYTYMIKYTLNGNQWSQNNLDLALDPANITDYIDCWALDVNSRAIISKEAVMNIDSSFYVAQVVVGCLFNVMIIVLIIGLTLFIRRTRGYTPQA